MGVQHLTLYWDSIGPMTWQTSLWEAHDGKGHGVIVHEADEVGTRVVAGYRTSQRERLLHLILTDIVTGNGEGYGFRLMGGLPTDIWLGSEVFNREALKEALWNWMLREAEAGPWRWALFEEEIGHLLEHPNGAERALWTKDHLAEIFDHAEEACSPEGEAKRVAHGQEPLGISRRLLLDAYMKRALGGLG